MAPRLDRQFLPCLDVHVVALNTLAFFAPGFRVPHLNVVIEPGDDSLAVEAGVLPQARGDQYAALLVEDGIGGIGENKTTEGTGKPIEPLNSFASGALVVKCAPALSTIRILRPSIVTF